MINDHFLLPVSLIIGNLEILQKANNQSCITLLMAGQGVHFIDSGMECLELSGLKHLAISGTALTLELASA